MSESEPKLSLKDQADAAIILTAWDMLSGAEKVAVLKQFPENIRGKIARTLTKDGPEALANNTNGKGELTPEFSQMFDERLNAWKRKRRKP